MQAVVVAQTVRLSSMNAGKPFQKLDPAPAERWIRAGIISLWVMTVTKD